MMKGMLGGLLVAIGLGWGMPAAAQETQEREAAEKFMGSLTFREGEISVPDADATFRLTPAFRYLDKADARRVLEELWGNPPDDSVLGMVVPATPRLIEEGSWAVVVTYSQEGYVSDADAAKIDYDDLLSDLKQGTRDENAARKEAGFGTVDLLGWAVPPRYDAATRKLYWAKELSFDGSDQHTLNYDIRVLGRHGYLSLNAIAGMSDLPAVQGGMQELLPMTEFNAGARYADFNQATDKVATYGLAALVGGGLAAKAGLFAKLGLILAKFWKLLLIALVGLGALVKRMLGTRKQRDDVAG